MSQTCRASNTFFRITQSGSPSIPLQWNCSTKIPHENGSLPESWRQGAVAHSNRCEGSGETQVGWPSRYEVAKFYMVSKGRALVGVFRISTEVALHYVELTTNA